jgi:hypothetical protein
VSFAAGAMISPSRSAAVARARRRSRSSVPGPPEARTAGSAVIRTPDERVHAIRVFNRFWTERIAVLQAGMGQAPYSRAEARVLFELAQRDATRVVDLRRNLGLTGGYVSRMLATLAVKWCASPPKDGRWSGTSTCAGLGGCAHSWRRYP